MVSLKITSVKGVYTNLGLLLSYQCPFSIKLTTFQGTVKNIFLDCRESSGSLFRQLDESIIFIRRYISIRSEIHGLKRIDIPGIELDSIREALLNILVHRDYSISASSFVNIFDDRIEFTSLGRLLENVTLEDIMEGASILRNERLSNVFYRLRFIEAYGVGIPRILHNGGDFEVKPKIKTTDNLFIITLPNRNFQTEIGASVPKQPVDDKIEIDSAALQDVVDLFEKQRYITRETVEKTLAVSKATALRHLKKLVDKKIILPAGSSVNRKYKLNNLVIPLNQPEEATAKARRSNSCPKKNLREKRKQNSSR